MANCWNEGGTIQRSWPCQEKTEKREELALLIEVNIFSNALGESFASKSVSLR